MWHWLARLWLGRTGAYFVGRLWAARLPARTTLDVAYRIVARVEQQHAAAWMMTTRREEAAEQLHHMLARVSKRGTTQFLPQSLIRTLVAIGYERWFAEHEEQKRQS